MLSTPTKCGFAQYAKRTFGKKTFQLKYGLLGYLTQLYTHKCECIVSGTKNRGTGAGGAKTNVNGKTFEQKTENETRLMILYGFERKIIPNCKGKFNYYLEGKKGDTGIIYLTQNGAKAYFKFFFKKEILRCPDEAYLIGNGEGEPWTFKILEKKNQNTPGSVADKLLTGPSFIKEYEFYLGPEFKIKYAYCLSSFLKTFHLKSMFQRQLFADADIQVLFGDDDDYYFTLDKWIGLI